MSIIILRHDVSHRIFTPCNITETFADLFCSHFFQLTADLCNIVDFTEAELHVPAGDSVEHVIYGFILLHCIGL